jgi:hypothetical protein
MGQITQHQTTSTMSKVANVPYNPITTPIITCSVCRRSQTVARSATSFTLQLWHVVSYPDDCRCPKCSEIKKTPAELAEDEQAFGQQPTRGGKRPNSGAPIGNSNAAKSDSRRLRNRNARISQADTKHFAAIGLPRVAAALEALHTGEAIYMLISPEHTSEIDEVIAHLEAAIEQHRYDWHPSHTENTMRGLVAALGIAKANLKNT